MKKEYVTIVMYHYVRDLKHSRYPEIKGLDIAEFREQVLYLKKHYEFITMEMLIDSIENNTKLPKNPVLLSFDDAYVDHFNYVFPFLDEHNIQGSFYPPVKAITEHTVLDVNKIHFILASCDNNSRIIKEIKDALKKYSKEYNLRPYSFYYEKLATPFLNDSAEVIFIKRLLQVELDEVLRNIIVDDLFEKFIGRDEVSFSRELYMTTDQIKCLNRNGMHIGSHSYDHYWLGSLNRERQEFEIQKSIEFLNEVGTDMSNWTMCYPYGDYNDNSIDLLKKYRCKLALSTKFDITDLRNENRFALSRLDTNHLPKNENAETDKWFSVIND